MAEYSDEIKKGLSDLIHSRRSIRKFKKDPIPPELLEKIIGEGFWAPKKVGSTLDLF